MGESSHAGLPSWPRRVDDLRAWLREAAGLEFATAPMVPGHAAPFEYLVPAFYEGGALVDEDALIAAIASGKLAAAGLDCFKVEPGGNPALSERENIFMLPHIGSATTATRDAMGFRALDNLDAFFAGKTPQDAL